MANGIANNEREEKEPIKKPAEQDEKSLACVMRLAQTERELDVTGKPVRGCKEQLRAGEYVTIKITDKPVQITDKVTSIQIKDYVKNNDDNEMTI